MTQAVGAHFLSQKTFADDAVGDALFLQTKEEVFLVFVGMRRVFAAQRVLAKHIAACAHKSYNGWI